jgi:hypothetical protein
MQLTVQHHLTVLRNSYQHVTGRSLDDLGRLDAYVAEIVASLCGVDMLKNHLCGKVLLDVDFDAVKTAIRQAEGGEQRKELERTIESIASIEGIGDCDPVTAAIEGDAILALIATRDARLAETRGDLFKRLHEAADRFIASGTWPDSNQCPLCLEMLDVPIAEHIHTQLGHYKDVAESVKEIVDKWRSAVCAQRLAKLENFAPLAVPATERLSATLGREVADGTISPESVRKAIDRLTTLEGQLADKLAALRSRKDQLERELPQSLVQLTEQVEYGRQFKESFIAYHEKQEEEKRIRARSAIRERWRNFLAKSTSVYSDTEVALSKARITAIDTEYKAMFKHIMNVGDIVPEPRRDADREDLHVQLSDFHGEHALSCPKVTEMRWLFPSFLPQQ